MISMLLRRVRYWSEDLEGLGTRVASWGGVPLDGPWEQPALWEVLWGLAQKAKRGQGLDHTDFGTDRDATTVLGQHALSCRINRLRRHLPSDLRKVNGQNSLTQILKIPAHEIYLAEVFYDEVYEVGTDANIREVREALHLAGL